MSDHKAFWLLFKTILLCMAGLAPDQLSAEPRLVSVDQTGVVICPAANDQQPPDFSDKACTTSVLHEVNPQNQSVWIKMRATVPEHWLTDSGPLALFVYAKSSSAAYINGQFVGQNGTPAIRSEDELPGVIDKAFHVPRALLQADNEIVIHLSSHHGLIDLARPIHFIGLGDYAAPETLFERYTGFSMMLLGALMLATLYFLVLRYRTSDPNNYGLFLLMGVFATAQLSLEIARGVYAYLYPLHDLRLILITACAAGFGLTLLTFVARKFDHARTWQWVAFGALITGILIWLTPSFDIKSAIAVLIPAVVATVILAIQACRTKAQRLIQYTAAFIVFDIIVLITLSTFHHITYYLIIAAMTTYLFVSQARAFEQRRQQLMMERAEVEKLSFRLEQLQQQETPTNIVISSAGEVHHISTNEVRLCKASGDYVELHLENERMQLYSGTMKELAAKLPSTFLRVHRSFIVNLEHVATLRSTTSSGVLILSDGNEVPVSRRLLPAVRDTLKADG